MKASMSLKSGFSLIELLVVIVIIALLSGLLTFSITTGTEKARQSRCQSNLRQIHTAMVSYANDNDGVIVYNTGNNNTTYGFWDVVLSPYLGFRSESYYASLQAGSRPRGVFACPSSKAVTTNGSRADYGKTARISSTSTNSMKLAAIQNPSQVIFAADSLAKDGISCQRDLSSSANSTWGIYGRHLKNANILYFDGHVEAVTPTDLSYNSLQLPWSPNPTP